MFTEIQTRTLQTVRSFNKTINVLLQTSELLEILKGDHAFITKLLEIMADLLCNF